MSYHTSSNNQANNTNVASQLSGVLTYIDGSPLFNSIENALSYGRTINLTGYHTHTFQGIVGYMAGFTHSQAVQTSFNTVNEIKSFEIDTTDLTVNRTIRQLKVTGDIGAKFKIQVIQKSSSSSVLDKFYDFTTNTFVAPTGNINQTLVKVLKSKLFSTNIVFPAATTNGYRVVLMTDPDGNTNISQNITGGNKNVVSRDITQNVNRTITFAYVTSNTSSYTSNPPAANVTSVSFQGVQSPATVVDLTKTLTNTSSDANGFGLRITDTFDIEQDIFVDKTYTLVAEATDSFVYELNTVENLIQGAELVARSGGSLDTAGAVITPTGGGGTIEEILFPGIQVNGIDSPGNRVHMDVEQNLTMAADETLTYRVRGLSNIKAAYGDIDFTLNLLDITQKIKNDTDNFNSTNTHPDALIVSKTTSGATGSGTTIALNGTYGISAKDSAGQTTVKMRGYNITADTAVAHVNSVSSSGGSVLAASSVGAIPSGATITFIGSSQTIPLSLADGTKFQATINTFPNQDLTISIDLDKFITPGINPSP